MLYPTGLRAGGGSTPPPRKAPPMSFVTAVVTDPASAVAHLRSLNVGTARAAAHVAEAIETGFVRFLGGEPTYSHRIHVAAGRISITSSPSIGGPMSVPS